MLTPLGLQVACSFLKSESCNKGEFSPVKLSYVINFAGIQPLIVLLGVCNARWQQGESCLQFPPLILWPTPLQTPLPITPPPSRHHHHRLHPWYSSSYTQNPIILNNQLNSLQRGITKPITLHLNDYQKLTGNHMCMLTYPNCLDGKRLLAHCSIS